MRALTATAVLVLGVSALGLWGYVFHAPQMQNKVSDAAAEITSRSIHLVTSEVLGRDITVTGSADTEAERATLLNALNAVPGRRVVHDQLAVLPKVDPFTFTATGEPDAMVYQGHVPHATMRAKLATLGGTGAQSLTLASGAPESWANAVETGITALTELQSGTLSFAGTSVTLSGLSLTPVERDRALTALNQMPQNFAVETDFQLMDDGIPAAFRIDWDITRGGLISGKLPVGLTKDQIASKLGFSALEGDIIEGHIDGDQTKVVLAALDRIAEFFVMIDRGSFDLSREKTVFEGVPTPGTDLALLRVALQEALPGVALSINSATEIPAENALRKNALTGDSERFVNGFWLPELSFGADASTCATQSKDTLQMARIGFVTGSARLGATALVGLNRLAAVMRPCVFLGRLSAEIGGHTDDTGDARDNIALSLARAQSVQTALVARGVPKEALSAVGHGESKPIAENVTIKGRARNRRTTITWLGSD